MVRRAEINELNGKLSDSRTWKAKGQFHFCNPLKKNILCPLFTIPSELILRLGLDPHVLNPVTGSIYFNLLERRLILTRFKDIYSEGRGSKFYLDTHKGPSWVDLDGQLSVHIRMKQYNLIFKIAELFSVSIQGSYKKPKYTLQRAHK